ncbi:MAG: CbbX protein [Mycobacterium sp.]
MSHPTAETSRKSFGFRGTAASGPQLQPDPTEPEVPLLPPDAVVDLAAARRQAGVDEVLAKLDTELVGLGPVKTRIAEIAALLLVDRMRALYGVTAPQPTLHMCFTGNPGTGKTTVALRMADLLHRLGYLRRGHLVSVTRDDLVGEYVGHTAPKTKEVIKRAMGGVLFIDEAYYLYKAENERDYGSEAIEILLQVMENNRDDLVVILAGYADKMDRFFSANPGMQSRVAHHITFPDYTVDELEQIASLMTEQIGYSLSADAQVALREYLHRRIRRPWFANARSVRNAMERARLRHARRVMTNPDSSANLATLTTIEAADLLASRVFDVTDSEAVAQ